ncbi:hypothetical protein M885DRAFT_614177, partial [Pelagophyceae sp. CCMP2097]
AEASSGDKSTRRLRRARCSPGKCRSAACSRRCPTTRRRLRSSLRSTFPRRKRSRASATTSSARRAPAAGPSRRRRSSSRASSSCTTPCSKTPPSDDPLRQRPIVCRGRPRRPDRQPRARPHASACATLAHGLFYQTRTTAWGPLNLTCVCAS